MTTAQFVLRIGHLLFVVSHVPFNRQMSVCQPFSLCNCSVAFRNHFHTFSTIFLFSSKQNWIFTFQFSICFCVPSAFVSLIFGYHVCSSVLICKLVVPHHMSVFRGDNRLSLASVVSSKVSLLLQTHLLVVLLNCISQK